MNSISLEPIAYVKNEKSSYTFHWRLVKFSKICLENVTQLAKVWSPIFKVGERDGKKLRWESCIGVNESNISCSLYLLPSNWTRAGDPQKDDVVKCTFKIGFGNNHLDFAFEKRSPDGHVDQFTKTSPCWGFTKLMTVTELYKRRLELLQDDTLRVTIHMEMFPDNKNMDHIAVPFFTSFVQKDFSDVTIKCGERTFHCHKFILSCRSSVFNRMFDSGLTEAIQGQVHIEDMEPNAVETLLKFIYTGRVDLPENCSWTEIIHGAEKYDLEDLKEICFKRMFDQVTADDFGILVLTANKYNANPVVKVALNEYYKRHMTELMENANFRYVLFKNPTVFYEDFKG